MKTVSAFATIRRISAIRRGWDELYIIYLDRSFLPAGFWIIAGSSCMGTSTALKGRCCPDPATGIGGSKGLTFGPNRVDEMMKLIGARLTTA